MPPIWVKFSLIGWPVLIDVCKIGKIIHFFQLKLFLIVNFAMPMELIHPPVSFISKLSIRIIEITFPMHKIIFPLPLINTSFFVVKFPKPISHIIEFLAFISTCLICLYNILVEILFISGARIWALFWLLFDCRVIFSIWLSFRSVPSIFTPFVRSNLLLFIIYHYIVFGFLGFYW